MTYQEHQNNNKLNNILLNTSQICYLFFLQDHLQNYQIKFIIIAEHSMSTRINETPQIKQKHNFYQFFLSKGRKLVIDSSFDNGNIVLSKQINQLHYRLSAVSDYENILNKKTWFYFRIRAPENIRIRIAIDNVNMFENMYQDKNWNRPVCREGEDGTWQPVKEAFIAMHQDVEIIIDYTFTQNKDVYFALTIPFTYFQHQQYLNQLAFHTPQNVALKQQIIGYSPRGRPIHVISLTQKLQQGSSKQKILQTVSGLARKPVVLITARVHAGEVSSSYCLMGMIQFLLRPYNIQSCILRKMFEFIIFPLVNPDGVYQGNYRMDTYGQNLNRVYGQPDSQKQYVLVNHSSSVYHIKNYVWQLTKQTKIIYHFDLHSHSSSKQAFIYGNAFEDIVSQTQSQVFCKLLEQNSSFFKYSISQFGQKHMKAKDKGQALSKQGCARVVFSKMANIINSYTVQTSIFKYQNDYISNDSLNNIEAINPNFEIGEMYYEKMLLKQQPQNIIGQNKQLGYSIMISILDHLNKNPFSTILPQLRDQFRKDIASNLLQNEDRFKLLDMKAYHKSKNIFRFVKEQFTEKYDKLWSWLGYDKEMATASWPNNFKWFSITPEFKVDKKKILKMRTQASEKQLKSANKIELTECKIKKKPLLEKQYSIVPPQNLNLDAIPIIRRSIQTKPPPICRQPYERAKTMQNIEQDKMNTQMLKINRFRENQTVAMKNNLLLTFIEEQITRLNEKKAKKNISAYNRLISYKAALKDKSKLQKTRFNNQKLFINSSKKLVSIYDRMQLVRQKSQQKIIERESDENLEENDIFNQLLQENLEQQDELNQLRRKRQTINCKRQIAKAKFNEIKKKTNSIADKKLKDTNQNFTTGIKLPQLSNIRFYMGQKLTKTELKKQTLQAHE